MCIFFRFLNQVDSLSFFLQIRERQKKPKKSSWLKIKNFGKSMENKQETIEKQDNLCLSSYYYRNKGIFEKEKLAIFEREWQLLCLETELPEIGSFVSQEIAGKSVLVVKTENGIKCYLNVCRHRGNTLVKENRGTLKSQKFITCGYHGWTFNSSDGSLYAAPKFKTEDLCKENWPLHSVRSESWKGIIFVNLEGKAPPLKTWLADIPKLVEKYKIEEFDQHHLKHYSLEANWKAFVDGYQECYHCALVHPNLNKVYDLKRYSVTNVGSSYSLHNCERKSEESDSAKDLMGGTKEDQGVWVWKYPNITISCYPYGCFIMSADALKTNKTALRSYFLFDEKTNEEQMAKFQEYIDTNVREDAEITEQIQKNMDSQSFKQGPLHPQKENGVIFFHSLVQKSLSTFSNDSPIISIDLCKEQKICDRDLSF